MPQESIVTEEELMVLYKYSDYKLCTYLNIGTRRCNNQNCTWDKEYCFTSNTFTTIWSEV